MGDIRSDEDDGQRGPGRHRWPIAAMVLGAFGGAFAMFLFVGCMVDGMGAAGGGDKLDGIEVCLPIALLIGAAGGVATALIVSLVTSAS